jgi:hypothetical protein
VCFALEFNQQILVRQTAGAWSLPDHELATLEFKSSIERLQSKTMKELGQSLRLGRGHAPAGLVKTQAEGTEKMADLISLTEICR